MRRDPLMINRSDPRSCSLPGSNVANMPSAPGGCRRRSINLPKWHRCVQEGQPDLPRLHRWWGGEVIEQGTRTELERFAAALGINPAPDCEVQTDRRDLDR